MSSIARGKVATTRDVGHWNDRCIRTATLKRELNFKHPGQFIDFPKGSKPLDISERVTKLS